MNSSNSASQKGPLDEVKVARFDREGYIIERGLFDPDQINAIAELVDQSLVPPLAPLEYEADVHYPGSPASRTSKGGLTPRRLLHAYTRHPLFQEIAGSKKVVGRLQQLMRTDKLLMSPESSQLHHDQTSRLFQYDQLA